MKIRSITSFVTPIPNTNELLMAPMSAFSRELVKACQDAGLEVESTRLALPPLLTWLGNEPSEYQKIIQNFEWLARNYGWLYLSAGPVTPDRPDAYDLIPELLAATTDVFFSAVLADKKAVYPAAAAACADIIHKASFISADGFTNLRFAALANVPPHAPFFPAAYHAPGDPPACSLAMECADEAVKAFSEARTLDEARRSFIGRLEEKADLLTPICQRVAQKHNVIFKGFDFSPAPFPEDWCSLGKAFELLGPNTLGQSGSLAAAAFIADALDSGDWMRCGFNGLMLAVLEDSVLAARAASGFLTIKDLLLYSAVCGTGLDTIPLPGDTSVDDLTSLLLDLGALATRLGKPLTGRLMPIPGRQVGDRTEYDFGYFANSRVMNLDGQKNGPLLANAGNIPLKPRKISE